MPGTIRKHSFSLSRRGVDDDHRTSGQRHGSRAGSPAALSATVDDGLMGVALLAGPANVVMQLARPGVGYGVQESKVESGRVDRHPVKRARTTFTYLAVAGRGSDRQKAAFRRAVNGAHAQVRSTPDEPGAVQRLRQGPAACWVAACLYKGSGGHSADVRRGDGRRDRRQALSERDDAGHHAAGTRRDVAARPGRLRQVLAGTAGQGAHR